MGAFLVVLGAIVGAGLVGRLSVGPFPKDGDIALASPAVTAPSLAGSGSADPASSGLPSFPEDTGLMLTSGPGDIVLLAKRHAETVFVHGDVYPPGVTWVFMSLRDDSGRIAGWASVSVPGAAGPAASGAPTLRFDVELAIPTAFDGALWVQAHAYDAQFGLVASARVDTPVTTP